MTGGRRPVEYDERDERGRPERAALSWQQLRVAAELGSYQQAMKFRRRTNRTLRTLEISFAQWRVLEATWRLVRDTGDAVGHYDVSRDLELDEASVSRLMHLLGKRGWVSHGPDFRFYAWRVFVTEEGEALVAAAYLLLAGASPLSSNQSFGVAG